MRIHGLAWVILGIFIWIYTSFIEKQLVNQTLPFFRWAAIAFLIWGAIRLTSQYALRRQKKEVHGPPPRQHHPQPGHGSPHQTHQHVRHPHGSHHQTHQHAKPHPHVSHHVQRSSFKSCPHCHRPVHAQSPICPSCHNRV